MNRLAKIITILICVSFVAVAAFAAEGGNPKKGKYLWKKTCKQCHVEGESGGVLSPSTKTQKSWDRFFEKNKHKKNPDAWKKFSDKDLQDIQQYMYDHAMDSDQPETCG